MEQSVIRPYLLAMELSQIFDLESSLDSVLAIAMYKLTQIMDSERSSIFSFDPLKQQLISFSSLDLAKEEIHFSKSTGVAGWVYKYRRPEIVNNAYDDYRFYKGVDDMTGFRTHNLICTPLIDSRGNCSGILQSLNKKDGNFTNFDLELLGLTARLMAVAIDNNRRYNEIRTTNSVRGKLIKQFVNKIDNPSGAL